MKEKLALVGILVFALFLRVVNIDQNPPALYGDELTLVYDAYSILKTGRDQTGDFLPLTFSMSEGRPPFYVYASLPFVALFGPNAVSARILSVMSGVGVVLLIYLLTKGILSRNIALIAAFLAAISPWSLSLSRGGFETNLALFLSLLGIVCLIYSLKKSWLLLLTAFSWGLAIHTYHSYKVVLPLFIPIVLWVVGFKKVTEDRGKVFLFPAILIFILFLGLWGFQAVRGSEVRFRNTNVFTQDDLNSKLLQKINEERSINPSPVDIFFHNKLTEYSLVLGENYLSHFSFDFLFLHGDKNPRHNQGLMGQMYIVEIVSILLGLLTLSRSHPKVFLLLLSWVAVSPTATTIISPAHALRSSFMLPPLIVLSATGFLALHEFAKKQLAARSLLIILVIGLVIQFVFLVNRVYFLYPNQFGRFWSQSAQMASREVLQNMQNYDFIILSDRIDSIHLAYPVYATLDPKVVQKRELVSVGGINFNKWGNVYLGDGSNSQLDKIPGILGGKGLYIGPSEKDLDLKIRQL